jgi:hypothetical protein
LAILLLMQQTCLDARGMLQVLLNLKTIWIVAENLL